MDEEELQIKNSKIKIYGGHYGNGVDGVDGVDIMDWMNGMD